MLLKLVDGEHVVVRTRTHQRALIPAALNLMLTTAVMSFLLGYINRETQPEFIQHYQHILEAVIWIIGVLLLIFATLKPLLQWMNRFTYLTNERIVQKNFIGAAQATVIPLALVAQSQVQQSRIQSMSAAADIVVVHGAFGRHQRSVLTNMPDAARFNTLIAVELGDYRRRAQRGEVSQALPYSHTQPPPPAAMR